MKRPGNLVMAVVGVGAVAAVLSRIGLSRIVSKYNGETEKDLELAFDAAEHADVVLLVDESDALVDRADASDEEAYDDEASDDEDAD